MPTSAAKWPKVNPPLSAEQERAREDWMLLWHEALPGKYGVIEKFNHGYPAKLPIEPGCKTLEIGPGIGGHLGYEDLGSQDYHVLEYREEFCKRLEEQLPQENVHQGSVEEPQSQFSNGTFDRVIAIHVLEHLRNLPDALLEIDRLLSANGVFDVVLPCEGGLAYGFARAISSKPMFEKKFGMSYAPIVASEHVNTLGEVKAELRKHFRIEMQERFPLRVPIDALNVCVGLRLKKIA